MADLIRVIHSCVAGDYLRNGVTHYVIVSEVGGLTVIKVCRSIDRAGEGYLGALVLIKTCHIAMSGVNLDTGCAALTKLDIGDLNDRGSDSDTG